MTKQEIQSTKNFIDTFEQVFDKDWEYSSDMLWQETFKNEMGTFLEGEWISNWIARDDLITAYKNLKANISKTNLEKMLSEFEYVFDKDWEYTKDCLGIDFKEYEGTFLHPNLSKKELEIANWGYRELLFKYYNEVKGII